MAIDYLQLLEVPGNSREGREREIAKASRQMKRLALDLQLPVIVGSQLNRNAEKSGKPGLHDLRESGAIEQDADIVILLHKLLKSLELKPRYLRDAQILKTPATSTTKEK